MKTISLKKTIFDVVTFVLVYFALQIFVQMAVSTVYALNSDMGLKEYFLGGGVKQDIGVISTTTTVISNVLALFLFTCLRWSPVSRNYLQSRPWAVLVWTATLALGTILPLEWIYERLNITLSEEFEQLFKEFFRQPLGYVAIGLLAPLVEELIFRGAILRVLLKYCGDRRHWIAIALSALVFAVVHGNLAQGVHAFVMGLLLGWLYYRTHSIVPGVVLHWVNNTVSYALAVLFPQLGDAKLIDFFQGSERAMYLGLFCSMCVFLPSLYQLTLRLRR